MKMRLWSKREVWCPTRRGWAVLLAVFLGLPGWWWIKGEEFLSATKRVEADVLVVEGWIGPAALHDAGREFQEGGYRIVVAAGLPTEELAPSGEAWDYAEVAAKGLRAAGVAREDIVEAPGGAVVRHRTYETALAVRRGLRKRGVEVRTLTVFAKGPHARRSRRVFEEVFSPDVEVGVIGWEPPRYVGKSWRSSSDRAESFVEESLAYVHEVLLNGGRRGGAP